LPKGRFFARSADRAKFQPPPERPNHNEHCQATCRPGRSGCQEILRPLSPVRIFDIGGCQRSFRLQDDGGVAAQINRYIENLHTVCGVVQRSCRPGLAVTCRTAEIPAVPAIWRSFLHYPRFRSGQQAHHCCPRLGLGGQDIATARTAFQKRYAEDC